VREGRDDADTDECSTRALLIGGTLDAVINQHPQTMVLSCVRINIVLRESLP
jgi:hypothetical protein